MKFKCRKCDYFGNKTTCPKCGGSCKIRYNSDEEREICLYIFHSFMDYPETSYWSADYEDVIKEMKSRGMLYIKIKKKVRIACKEIDHPIWNEINITDMGA